MWTAWMAAFKVAVLLRVEGGNVRGGGGSGLSEVGRMRFELLPLATAVFGVNNSFCKPHWLWQKVAPEKCQALELRAINLREVDGEKALKRGELLPHARAVYIKHIKKMFCCTQTIATLILRLGDDLKALVYGSEGVARALKWSEEEIHMMSHALGTNWNSHHKKKHNGTKAHTLLLIVGQRSIKVVVEGGKGPQNMDVVDLEKSVAGFNRSSFLCNSQLPMDVEDMANISSMGDLKNAQSAEVVSCKLYALFDRGHKLGSQNLVNLILEDDKTVRQNRPFQVQQRECWCEQEWDSLLYTTVWQQLFSWTNIKLSCLASAKQTPSFCWSDFQSAPGLLKKLQSSSRPSTAMAPTGTVDCRGKPGTSISRFGEGEWEENLRASTSKPMGNNGKGRTFWTMLCGMGYQTHWCLVAENTKIEAWNFKFNTSVENYIKAQRRTLTKHQQLVEEEDTQRNQKLEADLEKKIRSKNRL
ncbi:hypothetical protein B0H16DRAFT_1479214 [Mycena metata]|uniref:Uncharacterized protein n=1 Tax=Mycena metata TaxID=1033252 RepID=A0AAD7MDU6_9AGAR|nr:hypothetical protein B0H16DRAFT_1479214 [Mycena metata]